MKPTVIPTGNINNGNNGQGINNNNINVPTGNVSQDPNNNPAAGNNAQAHNTRRQFPNYQQGFGFDPDIDDIFSDTGIRSRLPGRMRDPFTSFGAHDTDNFFPGFGNMGTGRRNRTNPQNIGDDGFFSNFPDEFRQYIPEGFGFGRRGGGARQTVDSPSGTNTNQPPQQYYQQPTQQQYYQQPIYQQPGQYDNVPYYEPSPVPQSPKPHLCDAAIQTEDLAAESQDVFPTGSGQKLQQHGLRNTVDMGQKSVQEEENRGPRSHSAPPNNKDGQFINKSQQQHAEQQPVTDPVYVTSATFKTTAPKKIPPSVRSQGSQQQPYTPSPPNPPQRHSSIPQHQQAQAPTTPGGTYIRTVPIFVEGRQSPVINSHKEIPNQYQQEEQQQSSRPTVNTVKANIPDDANQTLPPQTPHTTDCINKITDIQRDVLDLMSKVENFKGQKNDKEYMYLDEMLTRNLLKLDTIDTNGKESIRLARKEAIKCIQASINVLEAKSGENAKAAANDLDITNASSKELNMQKNDETSSDSKVITEENPNILSEQTVIPLPPPPEHEPDLKALQENTNILDDQTVIALPPPPQPKSEQNVHEIKELETISTLEPLEENNVNKLGECTKEGDPIAIGDGNVKESSPSKDGAKKKIIKKLKKITKKDKEVSPSAPDAESKTEE